MIPSPVIDLSLIRDVVGLMIDYWLFSEREERIQKEKEQGTYKEKVSEEQVKGGQL